MYYVGIVSILQRSLLWWIRWNFISGVGRGPDVDVRRFIPP